MIGIPVRVLYAVSAVIWVQRSEMITMNIFSEG
jgi:hypothetical protein